LQIYVGLITDFNASKTEINLRSIYTVGPDSSVGIATLYATEGPGIESRWELDFTHLSRPAVGPTQPPIQYRGLGEALTTHPHTKPKLKKE